MRCMILCNRFRLRAARAAADMEGAVASPAGAAVGRGPAPGLPPRMSLLRPSASPRSALLRPSPRSALLRPPRFSAARRSWPPPSEGVVSAVMRGGGFLREMKALKEANLPVGERGVEGWGGGARMAHWSMLPPGQGTSGL